MTGPLSFSISAEQEALVEVAGGFAEQQLAPADHCPTQGRPPRGLAMTPEGIR
jgi:hypothetical protein